MAITRKARTRLSPLRLAPRGAPPRRQPRQQPRSVTIHNNINQRQSGPNSSHRAGPERSHRSHGLVAGPQIRDEQEAMDVIFASLAGRTYSFEPESFGAWRPQRLEEPNGLQANFARQLVTEELVPISASPIRGTSISALISQGVAWVGGGSVAVMDHPATGLAVFVLTEVGLTVQAVLRGHREALTMIAKHRTLERSGIPFTWGPDGPYFIYPPIPPPLPDDPEDG